MHELSIAHNILEIVRRHVPPADLPAVSVIRLQVGEQAGVVVDSLDFSFTALTADTPLQRARLDVERIPFQISCTQCHATSPSETGTVTCPRCGSTLTEVVSGTELIVREIEMVESATEVA